MGVLHVNVGDAVTPDWREIGCGGAATTTVTDDFNRANSTTTLGVGWTIVTREGVVGHWGIDTNRAYCVDSPVSGSSTFWQTLAVRSDVGADFDMTVTIATAPGNGALLAWRVSVAADDGSFGLGYFLLTATSGVVRLLSGASGGTNVASGTTFVSGDVVRVVAVGSSHSVYQNGTLVYNFTDTNLLTETWHGLAGRDPALGTNPRLDNFSLSSSPMVTGRLKLRDGTRWMREVCDDDTGPTTLHSDAFSGTDTYPTGPVITDGITWLARSPNYGLSSGTLFFDGHDFDLSNSAGRVVFPAEGPDGTMTVTGVRISSGVYYTGVCWRVSSVASSTALDYYWCLRSNGDVQKVVGNTLDATVHLACGAIPNNATVEIVTSGDTHEVLINGTSMGSFTDSFNNTATGWGVIADNGGGFGSITSFDISTIAPLERHPLKMWDGTTWQTVACMTPA